MIAVPGDGDIILHDFLYVDLARVRSLLGQLHQGVPEKVEQATERLGKWSASINLGVSLEGGRQRSERQLETRELGDLHFTMFEEAAEASGFLVDISDMAERPTNWTNGVVHEHASPGRIVRITSPCRIVDVRHFSTMFSEMASAFAGAKNKKVAGQIQRSIKVMYPEGISLRVMPCGARYPDHGFVGTLLERSDYIEPERAALFARYGMDVREWTVVALVTRAGERASSTPLEAAPDLVAGGIIQRSQLEGLIQQFSQYMESFGMSEAPRPPGAAITPLAVYQPIVGRADWSDTELPP